MPPFQYWFTGAALLAFFTFVGAFLTFVGAGYGWYRVATTEMESATNKAQSAVQRARTEQVKDLLGKVIMSGNKLVAEMKDKEIEQAQKEAEAWGTKTRDLISAAYGEGESELFLDSSGYVFYGDGSPMSNTRNWIGGRMRRVTELLQRVDTLMVRPQFDPAKFD